MLMLIRLPGTVIFSAHPKTLSSESGAVRRAAAAEAFVEVVFDLDRSHEGSRAETRCMAGSTANGLAPRFACNRDAVICRKRWMWEEPPSMHGGKWEEELRVFSTSPKPEVAAMRPKGLQPGTPRSQ